MTCEEFREWIQRELDHDLTQSEAQELDQHVRSCPNCAEEKAALLDVSSRLDDLPYVTPRFSLTEEVMKKIDAEDQRDERTKQDPEADRPPIRIKEASFHRKRRWWLGGSTVAAGIAILMIPLLSSITQDHSTQVQPQKPSISTKDPRDQPSMGIQSKGDGPQKMGPGGHASRNQATSPNGTYQATVQNQAIVIDNQSGEEVYRSKDLSSSADVAQMKWQDEGHLSVWLRPKDDKKEQGGDIIIIDVSSKTETKRPWK
ncbi:anti-sigma factor [Marininema halotolerans]|uniref:Anti-sigma-W factor RsiW n=1 Tax=Marininema halotolerans TaxID=1155944 RepID=A0A1I6RZ63_9BACL|nr:zf-HC2 domain-containing protein [Marininema halotolerans]SFS69987.1 Putative zinc-finger [Marininema halotolerans]